MKNNENQTPVLIIDENHQGWYDYAPAEDQAEWYLYTTPTKAPDEESL